MLYLEHPQCILTAQNSTEIKKAGQFLTGLNLPRCPCNYMVYGTYYAANTIYLHVFINNIKN